MRGRRQRGFRHQPGDSLVGARLGAAAGAVGDRHEARRQRLQPADAGPKLGFQRLGLGWEELETERGDGLRA